MLRVAFDLDLTEKTPTIADVTPNTTISLQEEGSVSLFIPIPQVCMTSHPHTHSPDA